MREIKFRAWDGKQMINDDRYWYLNSEHSKSPVTMSISCDGYLMQYTGLKDKNGVEIYEGDVVDLDSKKWHPNFAEVTFDRGAFCIRFSKEDTYYPDIKYVEDGQVIGNIYENPELCQTK